MKIILTKSLYLVVAVTLITSCTSSPYKRDLSRYGRAVQNLHANKRDAASSGLTEECNAGNLDACYLAATLLDSKTRSADAEKQFGKLCAQDHVYSCISAGNIKSSRGEQAAAMIRYRKACKLDGEVGCGWLGIAGLKGSFEKGDEKLVIDACENRGGSACYPAAKIEEAAGHLEATRKNFRYSCEQLHQGCSELGILIWRAGNKDKARILFKQACFGGETLGCRLNELEKSSTLKSGERKGLIAERSGKYTEALVTYRDACTQGETWSCHGAARILINRHGQNEAKDLLKKACDGGVGRACIFREIMDNDGVSDRGAIDSQARRGCSLGDGYSCLLIVDETKKEEERLQTACDKGFGPACINRARMFFATDKKTEARAILEPICTSGILQACGALAWMKHLDHDSNEAEKLARQSCPEGDLLSCHLLTSLLKDGKTGEALKKELCDRKDASSCGMLGDNRYTSGIIDDASALYRKGCELGDVRSCTLLRYRRLDSGMANRIASTYGRACITGDIQSCEEYQRERAR